MHTPCLPCPRSCALGRRVPTASQVEKLKASRNKGFEVLSAKHQAALAQAKADAEAAAAALHAEMETVVAALEEEKVNACSLLSKWGRASLPALFL